MELKKVLCTHLRRTHQPGYYKSKRELSKIEAEKKLGDPGEQGIV